MHNGSMLRLKWFATNYVNTVPASGVIKVLDVGSSDVNGSYRQIFSHPVFEYTGLDMVPGPNVDLVLTNPYDWSSIPTDTYDVVICGQVFEHIEFFWLTMVEMVRVLKQGGLLCLIAPFIYGYHRYPVDCYRFSADSMVSLARYTSLSILHVSTNCAPVEGTDIEDLKWWYGVNHIDSMLIGAKSYSGPTRLPDFKSYECVQTDLDILRTGLTPYSTYLNTNKRFRPA